MRAELRKMMMEMKGMKVVATYFGSLIGSILIEMVREYSIHDLPFVIISSHMLKIP